MKGKALYLDKDYEKGGNLVSKDEDVVVTLLRVEDPIHTMAHAKFKRKREE